jgi:hypothetical protein
LVRGLRTSDPDGKTRNSAARRSHARDGLVRPSVIVALACSTGCWTVLGIDSLSLAPGGPTDAAPADANEAAADADAAATPSGDATASDASSDLGDAPADQSPSDVMTIEGCIDAPSGLVHWYRGEQNPNDSVPRNPANGAWFSQPNYARGKVGFGFAFGNDGAAGGYVSAQVAYDTLSPFTIDLWVDLTSIPALPESTALSTSEGVLGMEFTDLGGNYDLLYNSGSSQDSIKFGNAFTGWMHLALTYDGTVTATTYQNGVASGSPVPARLPSITVFDIGRDTFNAVRFLGVVDEVHLFNRELDAGEIQAIYYAPGGLCPNL